MNLPEIGADATRKLAPSASTPPATAVPAEAPAPAPADRVAIQAPAGTAPSREKVAPTPPASTPVKAAPAAPPSPTRPATRPVTDSIPRVLAQTETPAPPPDTSVLRPAAGWTVAEGKPAKASGWDPANLDPSVSPRDDFYHYADGGWIKSNPIPAEMPRWGRFIELNERNTKELDTILQEAAKTANPPPGSAAQKLGDFYRSGMDEKAIEAAGITPLQPELDRIGQIHDLPSLQNEVARLHGLGVNALFAIGSTQDARDSTQVIGEVDQGGLGLPNCEYYTKDDTPSKKIRQAYLDHMQAIFVLMGDDPDAAVAEANKVMAVETAMAQHSRTPVQLRDPQANYNKMDVAKVGDLTPHFDWKQYLGEIGIPDVKELNVGQPEFFQALNGQLTSVPLADWKSYLRWHLINQSAPYLSSPFVDENFRFKGTILSGTPQNRPRWKRVVSSTDGALGELLGQEYVKKNFPPEAKARVKAMVENLKSALRDDLQTLPWMSPETRQKAIAKMDAFMEKIGYPDKWKDYSGLNIDRGPWVLNLERANQFAFKQDLAKIGKPVDRTEWGMTPPTVNAYYNPLLNEIVFPAGILQPPFFDPKADDAVNYGAIGAVIGHEMTHGFDDSGAQFDPQGNLKNWWTPADLKNFQERTKAISDLYSSFEAAPGLHINGPLVTGEATADLGGVALAYRAYEKSLEGKPRPGKIDGFTPEQRFFLGYAQIWAGDERPEFARLQVTTDPHPLSRFRVNGTLMNTPQFAKAFGVQPGDPMTLPPDKQTRIW